MNFEEFSHLMSSISVSRISVRGLKRINDGGFSVHHFESLNINDTLGDIPAPIPAAVTSFNSGAKIVQVLIMDLSTCGALGAPSVTESQVRAALSEADNPTGATFGQHIRSCSRGKLTTDIRVATVQMPCSSSGTLSSITGSYVWNSCPSIFY
jgi:hypothetical protein